MQIEKLTTCFTNVILTNRYFHRWPGRAHDARVCHRSPLYKDLPELCHIDGLRIDKTFHIIGDSAYPLSNNLMIPYKYKKNSLTQQQKTFNTNLASRRSVIERAFGLLGIRFPRLTHITSRSNEKRIKIVVAACILHNWCIMEDGVDETMFHMAENVDDIETDVNDHIPAALMAETRRPTAGGNTKREMLSAIISS